MSPRARKRWRISLLALMGLILLFFAFQLLFQRQRILHSLASPLYNHGKFGIPGRIWNWLADPDNQDDIPENSLARLKYKAGDHSSAKDAFSGAAGENSANPENIYNRGNAEYRLNDLDAALEDYKAAMLADPGDRDAKSNYELVLKRKGYVPPKPQPGDKDDQEDNQPDNQPDEQQPKPDNEDGKQKYNSILDALDQKEARDRTRDDGQDMPQGGKWW